MQRRTFWILLTTCSFLIVSFLLNIPLREGLFINGVTTIYQYQQLLTSPGFIFLQNLISYLSDTPFLVLSCFIIYFISKRKVSVLVFLAFFILNIYLNSVEKILFMDPRPFMYSIRVKQLQWHCPFEFGHPSGHSRMVFQFYSFLAFDVIGRRVHKSKAVWLMLLPIAMGVLVPQSRMYLGAHSSNQVILGLLLGIGWQVIYRYFLFKKLYQLVNYLILNKNVGVLLGLIAVNLTFLAIPLTIYQQHLSDPFPESYLSTLSKQCPSLHTVPTPLSLMSRNFLSTTIINIVFGMLMGIWLSDESSYRFLYGQWRYYNPRSWLKNRILRVIIEIIPMVVVTVLLFVIIPRYIRNDYLKYVVRATGGWLAGVVMVLWTGALLRRWEVIH